MTIPSPVQSYFNAWRSQVAQANRTRARSLARASAKNASNILGQIEWDAKISSACDEALRATEDLGRVLGRPIAPAGDIEDARNKALAALDAFGKTLELAKLTTATKLLHGLG
jgi:hypothetical protein